MEFIINRDQLLGPLQQTVGVIEKKQTLQILSNILVTAEGSTLTINGTDLEVQMVSKIQAEIKEPGSTTIPARKFLDLCRLLPAKSDIHVVLKGSTIRFFSNKSRFTLNCLPSANFPEFMETPEDKQFIVSAKQLKKALDKTMFCMASQDVRYYLNGLLFHISNKKYRLVASDGHRLAIFGGEFEQPTNYEDRLIIPRKGVQEINRLLDDQDKDVVVKYSNSYIKVEYGHTVLSAKLIDSKFPDFNKVFDQAFFEPITVAKQPFKEALMRVSVLASEQFKEVVLDIASGSINISVHNSENDDAEEDIETPYQGQSFTISFNSQYLLEAVNNIDSEIAVITIASNLSACFVDELDTDQYRFIVMPIKK